MPTKTQGKLQALALQYRNGLEAHNQAAADALERSLEQSMARVNAEVSDLLKKITAARAAGVPVSPAWLYQQKRLSAVRDAITREMTAWAPHASTYVSDHALAMARRGSADARSLVREAARQDLPGIEAVFTDINPANIIQMTAHLAPDGPLLRVLSSAGHEAAQAASSALVQGVALGKGSDWITRKVRDALDIPRWRAETIARTESLRAYREVSRQTYKASNVVDTWEWVAWIDSRTCVACVAMDGTEHPVDETLDGHPRCRCSMVPKTKTWAQLGLDPSLDDLGPKRETGVEWLTRQDPRVQRSLMGPAKYDAWKAGEFQLPDLVARTHSPDWGTMRRERSLVEIREGRNPNTWATKPKRLVR